MGGGFARNDRDSNRVISEGTVANNIIGERVQRLEMNPPFRRNIGSLVSNSTRQDGNIHRQRRATAGNNEMDRQGDNVAQNQTLKTSHIYVLLSAILTLLAIVCPPSHSKTRGHY